jgi:hypothetical protein
VEVTLGSKSFGFSGLTPDIYDRYIAKQVKGQLAVGERELVLSCLASGELTDLTAAFNRRPAVVKKIATAILESGEGEGAIYGDDSVTLSGVTFSPPELHAWESMREKFGAENVKFGPEMRAFLVSLADKPGEASAYFERFPGSVDGLYLAINKLAGDDIEITVKKD